MSNNLSEQLCELCGIEAKQFTKDFKTREKAASFGRKITGIPKFRGNKFDIGSYTDNKSIYQVHWKEFPDFTKPENFVRLFNLQTSIGDTVATLISRECYMVNTNIFIRDVLWFCVKYEDDPEASEAIMQSIRKAEWVYE